MGGLAAFGGPGSLRSAAARTIAGMPSDPVATALVVDDDDSLRRLIGHALRREGWRAIMSADATEARRLLDSQPGIDVVVLDGMLPDLHGADLAEHLLDDPATASLPICFLTGIAHGNFVASDGIACVVKPAAIEDLIAALHGLLEWRRQGGSTLQERRLALRRLGHTILL